MPPSRHDPIPAVHATPRQAARDHRPGRRLRAAALAQLDRAIELLAAPADARDHGIHHARKSLRRARALLALAAPAFGGRERGIDRALRALCRGLSPLRDGAALMEALERLVQQSPDLTPALVERTRQAARARRDAVIAAGMARDPDLASRRRRLTALRARLAALPWEAADTETIRTATQRSERRFRRALKRALRRDDEVAWHRTRRRVRRLRQQQTQLDELFPGWWPHTPGVDELAQRLGEAQDDALLLRRCGARSPFASPDRRVLRELALARSQRARLTEPDEVAPCA